MLAAKNSRQTFFRVIFKTNSSRYPPQDSENTYSLFFRHIQAVTSDRNIEVDIEQLVLEEGQAELTF